MKKFISFKLAAILGQWLFGIFVLFHLSVILGILVFDYVPIDLLWGGRMETREQLLNFEVISLGMMVLCLLIVLIRTGRIRIPALLGASKAGLWILFILFMLKTVGNLLAETTFEKSFAVFTALFSVLCLRLALESLTIKT